MPAVAEVATIIAAQPGYYVLSVSGGDGAPFMADKEAVLVWAIDSADSIQVPHPVTQGGIKVDAPVLRPDGTVAIGDVAWWSDVTAWLADKLEALADQRQQARDEVAGKQCGTTEKVNLTDKPVPAVSPAETAIYGVLEAASKVAP